ncbi:hypothetical protein VHEMI10700 [[Torrubiella] hemipterigena]|uniref:Uncharacterized protein n=1 Tax=[Torrubiella] hemipterigena TaxID=1531966 RepID=A0A0A1TSD0_9HYPO|nr:hypothetical protein VHEMI10700 [[Torrubiella] hemipterigena]
MLAPTSFVAIAILATLSPAQACLRLYGRVAVNDYGYLTVVDNGIQTCVGQVKSGDKNLGCINGYSLNYDYTDSPMGGPFPITYCNHGTCYSIKIPLDYHQPGQYRFDYTTFC